MLCWPGKRKRAAEANHRISDERSIEWSQTFNKQLTSAGIQPVQKRTRDISRANVDEQRKSALESLSGDRQLEASITRLARCSVHGAPELSAQPVRHRMSRIGTMARGALVKNIEDASKSPTVELALHGAAAGLINRLNSLGMCSVEMEGDGNVSQARMQTLARAAAPSE